LQIVLTVSRYVPYNLATDKMQGAMEIAMPTIVTEPRTQTSNRANPYLAGNYAPIDFETTSFALPVKGTIPEQLSGRLVRIGPNPSRLPDAEHAHWFTGLGMVHGLRLSDGRADWYRSRYVRAGRGARLLGLYVAPGPAGYDDFNVNTTVLHLGDGMYACVEAGAFPVELSYELDSISRSDLGGGLKCGFAEHAKTAPQTGEHFAIACQPGKPHVQYLVVGNDGVARQRAEIEPPHMPLIHDIAITQSSVIVLDLLVTFQSAKAKSGDFPYAWDGKREARVGLLPREAISQACSGLRRRRASSSMASTVTTTGPASYSMCADILGCSRAATRT